jgi:acyl carrier protein
VSLESGDIQAILQKIASEVAKTNVEPDRSLVRSGLLDSIKVVDLIAKVEDRFGIELEGTDLEVGNFETLQALTSLVTKKLG